MQKADIIRDVMEILKNKFKGYDDYIIAIKKEKTLLKEFFLF